MLIVRSGPVKPGRVYPFQRAQRTPTGEDDELSCGCESPTQPQTPWSFRPYEQLRGPETPSADYFIGRWKASVYRPEVQMAILLCPLADGNFHDLGKRQRGVGEFSRCRHPCRLAVEGSGACTSTAPRRELVDVPGRVRHDRSEER